MDYGRPPQPRRTRIRHPASSYVPFFVFLATLVLLILVIVFLVGRVLGLLGAPRSVGPGSSTATATAIVTPRVATPVGLHGGTGGAATPTTLPVSFAAGSDPAVAQARPAPFPPTTRRIYAFATLRHVPARVPVRFVWRYGPRAAQVLDVVEHTAGPAFVRHIFLSYLTPDTSTFAAGPYTVTVTSPGQPPAQGRFRVRPP